MPRRIVPLALVAVDLLIAAAVPLLALYIRLEGNTQSQYYAVLVQYLPVMVLARIVSFSLFGLYNRLWRYASINELLAIVGAVTLSSVFITAHTYLYGAALPRSIHVISWLLHILLIGSSRMFIRVIYQLRKTRRQRNSGSAKKNVLIIGAGDAGAMIAREMLHSTFCRDKHLIGFIDDAPDKKDQRLYGVRVLGSSREIRSLAKKHEIQEIIIAMPSVTGGAMRDILYECKTTGCEVKTLPGIYELIDGKVTVQQLRNVDITDLLRREPVKLNSAEIAGYLADKRVLVTGAGGSIG
ncbi:MAG TPA: polysaccharide biosynthesis protein, partial [Firmicutes bacterium]|nr:polysaccharide biosynthesis protein [Bacillota bacterium]